MAKLPDMDNALNIESTITKARDSIKRIEGTTGRINKIVHDVGPDTRHHHSRRADRSDFSTNFVSVTLVVIVAVLGMFGVIFFHMAHDFEQAIKNLENRTHQLEVAVKPPLRSSTK